MTVTAAVHCTLFENEYTSSYSNACMIFVEFCIGINHRFEFPALPLSAPIGSL